MAAAHDASDPALVAAHLERVQHLLLPMVVRYDGGELSSTPEGRAVLEAPLELRPSLAIAALAGPRSGRTAAHVAEVPWSDQWPAELVRALVRRRIDWDPDAAALALRLVAGTDFDDERIQLVLKAADRIAEVHPGHPGVMEGLDRLSARVRATATHRYRVTEMRARVTASIARHTPPELLDLSPVADTDTWGPSARQVLEAVPEGSVDIGALLGCLTSAPSSTTPSRRWLVSVDQALAPGGARRVVLALVRLLVDLDLEPDRPFVAVGNDDIARAAIWALAREPLSEGDLGILRDVAVRCSRTNGQPRVTEALCGKAAGAAVSVLGQLRGDGHPLARAALSALEELWTEVDRGDVLRRIGRALGLDEVVIAARLAEAKRAKARRSTAERSGGVDPGR